MNRAVLTAWLAALRSGDYVKGRDYLHQTTVDGGERFCCLGVLCDLARVAGVVELVPGTLAIHGYRAPGVGGHAAECAVLPDEVVAWAGLDYQSPYVAGRELTEWNDGLDEDEDGVVLRARSFAEIADLIEEHL